MLQKGLHSTGQFMQQLQALCPPSNALKSRSLAQRLNVANQDLAVSLQKVRDAEKQLSTAVAAASPLRRTQVACKLPSCPVVVTSSLAQAMHGAASVVEECHRAAVETGDVPVPAEAVPEVSGSLTVRHVFPSWRELEVLVGRVAEEVGCARAQHSPTTNATERDQAPSAPEADVQKFANCIEASLQCTLLWAQQASKPPREQDSLGAPEAVAVLQAFVQAPAVDKLACALASCMQIAGQLPAADAQVMALMLQLRAVLPMVRTVLVSMRAAIVHAVLLQAAFGHLTLVMIAVFASYVKEGYGEGISEEQEGPDGAGTGVCLPLTYLILVYVAVMAWRTVMIGKIKLNRSDRAWAPADTFPLF